MFRCNLPPALLAGGLESFMCHCDNAGVEQTLKKSQYTKLTLENKTLSPLPQGFELATFRSWVWHSYQQAVPTLHPTNHFPMLVEFSHNFDKGSSIPLQSSTVRTLVSSIWFSICQNDQTWASHPAASEWWKMDTTNLGIATSQQPSPVHYSSSHTSSCHKPFKICQHKCKPSIWTPLHLTSWTRQGQPSSSFSPLPSCHWHWLWHPSYCCLPPSSPCCCSSHCRWLALVVPGGPCRFECRAPATDGPDPVRRNPDSDSDNGSNTDNDSDSDNDNDSDSGSDNDNDGDSDSGSGGDNDNEWQW